MNIRQERLKGLAILLAPSHRQSTERAPVKGSLAGHDPASPRILARRLERTLDPLTTAIGEEGGLKLGGRDLGQETGRVNLNRDYILAEHHRVHRPVQLRLGSLYHRLIPVADVADGNARQEV